jgi:acyl dehydratase
LGERARPASNRLVTAPTIATTVEDSRRIGTILSRRRAGNSGGAAWQADGMTQPVPTMPPPQTATLSETDFGVRIEDRYFEDYQVGAVYEYGYATLGEAEIVAFAQRFDPQPMHIDPQFAAAGPFGGLIASGWHTAGVLMRMIADHYLSKVASLASPGIDELRWPAPVRPGDSLKLRATIVEARISRSKPDRGLVRTHAELLNQDNSVVLSLVAMNLLLRRDH